MQIKFSYQFIRQYTTKCVKVSRLNRIPINSIFHAFF